MNKMVRKVALLLAVAILCCFVFSAAADTVGQQQTVFLQDSFDTASALAYGVVPEHLYPFIYPGSNPYPWVEIDTANCTVGKIYVYNRNTDILTPIGSDTAKTYAATTDYLYYVTRDNTIKKTDYTGSSITTLYASSQGNIHNLSAFGNILYFIQNGKHLIFLDATTGNTQCVLTEDDLVSAFVFNEDKFVWYDSQDQARYYNLTTRQSVALKNPYEENALIAQYTASESENTAGNNTRMYPSSGQADPYNDITFPLDEYRAVFGVEQYHKLTVLDSFDRRYAGSGECDGFAKYAHDAFWHILIDNRTQPSWIVNGTLTDDVHGNIVRNTKADCALVWREENYDDVKDDEDYIDNTAVVTQFFRALDRGSFVRYGKADDDTLYDGSHSIVFDGLSDDGRGIIVYEANQNWNNGVGYQKYYFETIHNGYEWILYYVEHDVGDTVVCEDIYTHKVCCANCDAFLRQEHSYEYANYSNYSENEHKITYGCCSGQAFETHNFNGQTYWDDYTHTFYCVYCSAYQQEYHNFNANGYTPIDMNYHTAYCDDCGSVIYQDHVIHNYRCIDCGYEYEYVPPLKTDASETQ